MAKDGLVSFLMGATGAGLFTKAVRPGAPTEFVDSRSVEEYLASGEFERTLETYGDTFPRRLSRSPKTLDEKVSTGAVSSPDAAAVR